MGDADPDPRWLWVRIAKWLVPLWFVAAAVAVRVVWFPSQQPFHDLVADLRARGEPVEPKDFIPAPVPAAENGAALLLQARAWIDQKSAERDWETELTGLWNQRTFDSWYEARTEAGDTVM